MKRSQPCSSQTERKIVEQNRRNHMKNLLSILNSLLPTHHSSKALSLPDQIDESVEHIKSLNEELQKLRNTKQNLLSNKRRHTWENLETTLKPPKMEIREMGSDLEVVLTTGLDSQFIFYEIIRMLHEEGAEVVNACFSVVGNSIFHTFHARVGECMYGVGAARVGERLKRYVLN